MVSSLVIFILLCSLVEFECYPRGAPEGVCATMRPSHRNTPPRTDRSPYSIIATAESSNGPIRVSIGDSNEKNPFRGFFLQARDPDDRILSGQFTTIADLTKGVKCGQGEQSALTHVNADDKDLVPTVWIPPAGFNGTVIFRATVVKYYDTFWMDLRSNPVNVVSEGLTATPTAGRSRPSTLSTVQLSTATSNKPYEGCGVSKGCFGMPDGCLERETCEVILSYLHTSGVVKFEMVGALGSQNGWIAVGLSRTNKMGDDSVTECVVVGSRVIIRESWNTKEPKDNFILTGRKNITDESGEYEDGVITCKWSRPLSTVANGRVFDLEKDLFYLLLAKGPVDPQGDKFEHRSKLASANPVDLTSVSLVSGKPSTLIKIHGTFMTVAWITFVSLAILLARHYKEVWSKYKLCGTKVWFAVHRCFMLLSIALVAVGFIVIFVDVDGWSQVPNVHPILGCISTALMIMQPLIAACRPHPTDPKRPIFRWIHGLVGNGAQLIACINMFLAVSLKKSNLPMAFSWVLLTFIIFHCLVHLLIHIHSCMIEKERERGTESKHNQFQLGDGYDVNQDGPGSAFKRFALGLYSVVNIGLTAALVLMICLN